MLCVLVVSKREGECPCLRRVDMHHNHVIRKEWMLSLQVNYQKKNEKKNDEDARGNQSEGEIDR